MKENPFRIRSPPDQGRAHTTRFRSGFFFAPRESGPPERTPGVDTNEKTRPPANTGDRVFSHVVLQSRSQITRWLRGAGIDERNAEKVELLELVWSNLLRLYDREAALEWLFGINPHLGDRRPIDVVRAGRLEDLMRAIRAERAGSFA